MAFKTQNADAFHWLIDMLESVEVGLVVLDLEFRVQAWNGFMENHSGITASQIHNKSIFDKFPDIPKAWLTRKVDAVAMLNTRAFTSWEQRPYLFKFRNSRPITGTEEYMYQNLTISPLTSTTGEVDKVCLLIYDVTEFASSKRALERANEQLAKLSMTDRLTGLLNRGTWENLVDAEFERYRRYGHATALIMFDIDHFKPVNDTYGHASGDEIIKAVAESLMEQTRKTDKCVRWGGEEFIVLLPFCDLDKATEIAEKIRIDIAESLFDDVGQVTLSLGVTESSLDDTPAEILERVDTLLYQAKNDGKNRVASSRQAVD